MLNGKISYANGDIVKTRLVYRTIGRSGVGGRVGMGVMHKPGIRVDEENLEFPGYVLVYVIQGRGVYVDCHGNRYNLSAGCLFQRLPNDKHSTYIDPDSDWAECFVELSCVVYEALLAMGVVRADDYVYTGCSDGLIEAKTSSFLEKLERCSELELPAVLVEIVDHVAAILRCCHMASTGEQSNEMVEKGLLYLGKQCKKRPDVRRYCQENGWGYENFRKVFRAKVGMSPGRFMIRRRMDLACELLRSSHKRISDIAYELGYSSPYEFSAQFKREVGVSPRIFRSC